MPDDKTILIIEDEETLLEMYRLKFEASGFTAPAV
jgi:DNA-binding response OmpR family regulator